MLKFQKISYIDSSVIHGQTEEIATPLVLTTVGFVIKETDEYITLAAELVGDEYRRQISIPKIAIIK